MSSRSSAYLLHHDPRSFEEPERLDPERFATEAAKSIPRYAYLPFGAGPHGCIGAHFAMMQASLVLANVASRFHLEPVPGRDFTPIPLISLRPKDTVLAIAHDRSSGQPR